MVSQPREPTETFGAMKSLTINQSAYLIGRAVLTEEFRQVCANDSSGEVGVDVRITLTTESYPDLFNPSASWRQFVRALDNVFFHVVA